MVLAAPPPGSRWLTTPRGHPPVTAVVERLSAGGCVIFWESARARLRTGRGRRAKREHLPLPLFLRRYRPLQGQGAGGGR